MALRGTSELPGELRADGPMLTCQFGEGGARDRVICDPYRGSGGILLAHSFLDLRGGGRGHMPPALPAQELLNKASFCLLINVKLHRRFKSSYLKSRAVIVSCYRFYLRYEFKNQAKEARAFFKR